MRAYHRVDPLMDERKSHYTAAELGAYLKVQLLAGRQTRRGTFRSVAALRGALPAGYVRYLQFLIDEGDLVVRTDGTVYVDGWDEWQEGDLTVRDRMARLRDRKRNDTVTDTVTPSVTSTVTLPSPTAYANAIANADVEEQDRARDVVDDYYRMTARFPNDTIKGWLERLSNEFGYDATSRKLGAEYLADSSLRTLLGRVENALKSDVHITSKKAAEAEKTRLEEWNASRKVSPEQAAINQARIREIQEQWFKKEPAA